MAVNILKLPAEDNSLVIEVDAEGWARCYLVGYAGQERLFLGADDFSVIVIRLNEGLSKRSMLGECSAGTIEGHVVAWLLSLAKAHHALYIALSGPDRLLFWQDANRLPVAIVGSMCLSPERCAQWQESLAASLAPAKTLALAGR